jgi:hypothetical protein
MRHGPAEPVFCFELNFNRVKNVVHTGCTEKI